MRVQKLNSRRFLGALCFHGHEHLDTGGSLRYKGCQTCCVCNALSVKKHKKRYDKYREKNKAKMKKYQEGYRAAKKRRNEKEYRQNYYLTVTVPKRERERARRRGQ